MVSLSYFAVITVYPVFFAVTLPLLLTVAIDLSALDQLTELSVSTESCIEVPFFSGIVIQPEAGGGSTFPFGKVTEKLNSPLPRPAVCDRVNVI